MSTEQTSSETVADVIDEQEVAVVNQETESDETESTTEAAVTETDESATSDVDSETEVDKDEKPLKESSKKNFTKRIQQVISQREEARLEAERVKAELAELRSKVSTTNNNGNAETSTAEGFNKPKPEMHQFTTIGEFTEALSDWKDEKREYTKAMVARTEELRKAAQKGAETWTSREKTIKADLEDYDAVVNLDSLSSVNMAKETHQASRTFLNESEVGPAVLYSLLQDEELATKFKEANPIQQVKILTKLETAIEAKRQSTSENEVSTTAKEKSVSAPPKLKGGIKVSAKSMDEVLATGDFQQYAKWRQSQKNKA